MAAAAALLRPTYMLARQPRLAVPEALRRLGLHGLHRLSAYSTGGPQTLTKKATPGPVWMWILEGAADAAPTAAFLMSINALLFLSLIPDLDRLQARTDAMKSELSTMRDEIARNNQRLSYLKNIFGAAGDFEENVKGNLTNDTKPSSSR